MHGLNSSLGSSDLLILPQLVAIEVQQLDLSAVMEGHLLRPTPGAANQSSLAQIGPAIRHVTENPPPPAPGQDLVITAQVSENLAPDPQREPDVPDQLPDRQSIHPQRRA